MSEDTVHINELDIIHVSELENLLRENKKLLHERDEAKRMCENLRANGNNAYVDFDLVKERDEAKRMLQEERIRHRQKIDSLARAYALNETETKIGWTLSRVMEERDEALAKLAAYEARRCEGCEHYLQMGEKTPYGECDAVGIKIMYDDDHYCKSWSKK